MIRELQNFGLSEKEAKVYLALLELQKSTVQTLAAKAGVNRATTYVQLEALRSRGLVSQAASGKKTFYVAEPPENVSRLIEKEKVDVLYKEKEFKKVLPDLKNLYKEIRERPNVRFYEGRDSLAMYRHEILKEKHQSIDVILGMRTIPDVISSEVYRKDVKETYGKFTNARVLYVDKQRNPLFDALPSIVPIMQSRFVSVESFPIIDTEIDILDKKKFIIGTINGVSNDIPRGVAIDDPALCQAFQAMFEVIWSIGKK